jgi:hypothetical protein|tara:strand:+ start:1382 stop:1597 length:216 start_codon:yes stop_codon:yes gene_type:complete
MPGPDNFVPQYSHARASRKPNPPSIGFRQNLAYAVKQIFCTLPQDAQVAVDGGRIEMSTDRQATGTDWLTK